MAIEAEQAGGQGGGPTPADIRAARRLLACTAVALFAGAGLAALAPPVAKTAPIAGLTAPAKVAQAAKASVNPDAKADPKADPGAPIALDAMPLPVMPRETHEALTPSGLAVVAFLPPMPLTVRDRARLRADANASASVVETIDPGEPLRVVGAVDVSESRGGPWLQVRFGNGGAAYIQAGLVTDLSRWRQVQLAERLRRQQEEADAAERASGIDVSPDGLSGDLLGGAPIVLPPPSNEP